MSPGSSSGAFDEASATDSATPAYARRCTSFNCDTFTASVGWMPGATLVRRRSAPGAPTETVLGWSAMELLPIATELYAPATA